MGIKQGYKEHKVLNCGADLKHRLPAISPAKVDLFGTSRELQFRVSNHGEPCASPHTVSQQENENKHCYKGRKEDERVTINRVCGFQ